MQGVPITLSMKGKMFTVLKYSIFFKDITIHLIQNSQIASQNMYNLELREQVLTVVMKWKLK